MPLVAFLRYLSDRAAVSVVCEATLDKKEVTIDVVDQPVPTVLGVVARRLGVQISRTGHLYFLGSLRPEDKGVLVRKVTRLNKDELGQALLTLKSDHGKTAAFDDGLVVMGDTVQVLERVNELLDQVEAAPSWSWVVQLYVISVDREKTRDLGLDVTPLADVSLKLAEAGANPLVGAANLAVSHQANLSLNAVLQAARENRGLSMEAEPLLLLVDGETATVANGLQVPILDKAVSPEGTVTTKSVTYKQTGLQIAAGMRDLGSGRGRVKVTVGMDDVAGEVEGYPKLTSQRFETTAIVASGGVYLLGALDRRDHSLVVSGPLQLRDTRSERGELLQVWCRVYRVGGATSTLGGMDRITARSPAAAESVESGGAPAETGR
jgi:type II secretory pathway component GspD/PulD (secretin)